MVKDKVYAIRDRDTGEFLPKSSANAIYVRMSDARRKANSRNKYYKTTKYEVVSSTLNWEVE